ncbi:aspartyl-phosphate phosphatase Spo0E family protein [Halobacillus litoralis]|uniref:aspartyl-phosphate phosphatase Spo0E family protein n=1 Tax=Halobacillus litoralis TaxID=45668 RepID=UPI001CD6A0F5|nr:aspartyl-phosphate phosphatase Spo0E family protein [Halobacillus litoralis]MCA0972016.1 aspartyl-phosphate phosphatase Spo0E family protein [Halobacillus litoralis]
MKDDNQLEDQIEQLRKRMYQIYVDDPEDDQLLKVSQELDVLLNEFAKKGPTS